MTDTKELEAEIARSGVTKASLARALGISTMGLYQKIHNVTEFKASEIKICQILLKLTCSRRDDIFLPKNVIENQQKE